jgi:hypothetical protein
MATSEEVADAFTALEEGRPHVLLESLAAFVQGFIPQRDKTREEYLNEELAKVQSPLRWSKRRQVVVESIGGDPTTICAHGIGLGGECSECAAASIEAGL